MKEDDVYMRVIRYMARNCYRRLGPWASVKYGIEDLEQEGFIILHTVAYPRYDPGRGACFKTWLVTCLKTRYANIVKKENHYSFLREDWLCGYSDPPEKAVWGERNNGYEPSELYGLSHKVYDAANRRSPEDETIFRQAVSALLDAAPDFVELVLGTCPRACRGRMKIFTTALRDRDKRNSNTAARRNVVSITGRRMVRFLGYEKKFCDFKKILYNII